MFVKIAQIAQKAGELLSSRARGKYDFALNSKYSVPHSTHASTYIVKFRA